MPPGSVNPPAAIRLAKRTQTKAMIGRFNGLIADVLATTHVGSPESLAETITRYVKVYNQLIPWPPIRVRLHSVAYL